MRNYDVDTAPGFIYSMRHCCWLLDFRGSQTARYFCCSKHTREKKNKEGFRLRLSAWEPQGKSVKRSCYKPCVKQVFKIHAPEFLQTDVQDSPRDDHFLSRTDPLHSSGPAQGLRAAAL